MGEELLVAEAVRAAAADAMTLDPALVEEAVSEAVRAHLAGASVSEACEVGRDRLALPREGHPALSRES